MDVKHDVETYIILSRHFINTIVTSIVYRQICGSWAIPVISFDAEPFSLKHAWCVCIIQPACCNLGTV